MTTDKIEERDACSDKRLVRCGECRHWRKITDGGAWGAATVGPHGECRIIDDEPMRKPVWIYDHEADDPSLITTPEFGCTLGKASNAKLSHGPANNPKP